jgi:CRP/FNR family transcriptional regulator
MARKDFELEKIFINILSRELLRKQALVNLLASSKAEARVARFLVFLSEKYFEIGYSRTIFSLRMTRQEIGSYLGLSLETVSRALSALNAVGLIGVDQRVIKINESDIYKLLHGVAPLKPRANPYVSRKSRSNIEWEKRLS